MVATGEGLHGCSRGKGHACVVAPGGACMVAPGGVVRGCLGGGGMCGFLWGVWGHVWLLWGVGACVVAPGVYVVAPGGIRSCLGGHAWLLRGGMHGCTQGGMRWIRRDTEIRSMSGRYASSWNAFLLNI